MRVNDIFDFLKQHFPLHLACDFDNVGLLIGDKNSEVKNILVSLDCTHKTIDDAIVKNCELIITHHPVIFEPLKKIPSGTIVHRLIKSDISVISMHTNLDVAEGGVNSCLCKALGLTDIQFVTASDGFTLQSGRLSPICADDFAKRVKERLGGVIKYVDGKKAIEKVLVCSGSGGSSIYDAISFGFDALVTADVKHNQFLSAADNSVSLFDCGHFHTEDVIIDPLTELLKQQFPKVNFYANHHSYIKFI